MHHYYILQDKNPVPVDSATWGDWFIKFGHNRRVALTETNGVTISTVFLGLNHNFCEIGEPILFETMVFGGQYDECQQRYSTYDEAITGHQLWCALAVSPPA